MVTIATATLSAAMHFEPPCAKPSKYPIFKRESKITTGENHAKYLYICIPYTSIIKNAFFNTFGGWKPWLPRASKVTLCLLHTNSVFFCSCADFENQPSRSEISLYRKNLELKYSHWNVSWMRNPICVHGNLNPQHYETNLVDSTEGDLRFARLWLGNVDRDRSRLRIQKAASEWCKIIYLYKCRMSSGITWR